MPKICASLMHGSIEDFLSSLKKAKKLGAQVIEIRADGLENQSRENIKKLLREVRKKTNKEIIFTLRKKEEGGKFKGSEEERIEAIKACLDSDFDFLDIELSTEKKALKAIAQKAREKNKKLIISFHDFKKTPSKEKMLGIIKNEFEAGADIAKLAVKTNSREEVLNLLEVILSAKKFGKVITIGMGEIGKVSRILAPFFGSEITYGYLSKPTAEGQMSVENLKKIFEAIGL